MAAFVEGSVYRVRGEAVVEVGGARSLLNNCRVGFFSTTPNDLNSDSNDGNGAYKEPGWKPSVADARWIGPLSTIGASLGASHSVATASVTALTGGFGGETLAWSAFLFGCSDEMNDPRGVL